MAERDERGAATAELVMVIPLLVAVTIGLVWLLSVGAAQIQVVDAARETARAVARGDDNGAAVARGRRIGPAGTQVRVSAGAEEVVASAQARVAGPGGIFSWMPGVTVRGEAVAATEATLRQAQDTAQGEQ
ncbi:TadE family protein [Nocardioides panzhihuensis]|uniref:Flp pilus assembly protein TadG n=1 Tax=Nocardioides panzhihuensis TaxID=860243 RepID=A0A7Z0IUP8_9ACTN|nr:TadE family protein [Nocardioides panzhihuensis]NYI80028.1 Flp pilus assembly protein TadG [Nocardioides panzhihuensis]